MMLALYIIAACFMAALIAIAALALFPRLNIWHLFFAAPIAMALAAAVWLLAVVGQYEPRVIARDHGGSIPVYVAQIRADAIAGRAVRITGRCDSSCTMYLSLPTACVSRSAVLGFHGPSSQLYGISLPPAQFDHWSRVMASHYPHGIRAWFMTTARHQTMGILPVPGAELIAKHGIKECAP